MRTFTAISGARWLNRRGTALGAVFSFSPGGRHTRHPHRKSNAASRPARSLRLVPAVIAALLVPIATSASSAAAAPGRLPSRS